MSSNEEEHQDGDSPQQDHKKRRVQRACDFCRRRKTRCNGVQMPGNRCSNCISYRLDCTYVEAARKRGPPTGSVEALQNRLERVGKLLHKLCPDKDLLRDLDASLDLDKLSINDTPPQDGEYVTNLNPTTGPTNPTELITKVIRHSGSAVPLSDNPPDDFTHPQLTGEIRPSMEPTQERFFGKSSSAMLVRKAIDLKHEYIGQQGGTTWEPLGTRRPEFWSIRPWEEFLCWVESPSYIFPDDDLLYSLIDLYFLHINLILPLLHRPTFDKSITAGLHFVDSGFGAVVLLVCALGSRYSDDPRVLLDDVPSHYAAGWRWFNQVQMVKKSFLIPPTLSDLQFYSLSVQYLLGCSGLQQCWALIGIGIRMAQDVGAHRRKYNVDNMTAEDEMWKRAFWVLVCLDHTTSSLFGRPCAIHEEDFDIDLPVECDDEYFDHPDPAQRFKQPPNKPSYATAFVLYIKVLQILGLSLRTIYSINKSKVLLGFIGNQWEQNIVAELDSALNKWVDSVPDYLRWDPNLVDEGFFNQAASLYCAYYYTQIVVHRPFIPSVGKPSPLSFPSLAICTNAARSCSHIIDVHSRRNITPTQFQLAAFTSGIVLLLSIWSGKRSGLQAAQAKEMAEVYKCMHILKQSERRWHVAGRLWDILYELAVVGDLPLPTLTPPPSNKRESVANFPVVSTNVDDKISPSSLDPTPIAGSQRVSSSTQTLFPPSEHAHRAQQHGHYTRPMYTEELGCLPAHDQVAFLPEDGIPPNDPPSSYSNHAAPHGAHFGGASSLSLNDTTGGSSLSTDEMALDSMGLNYNTFFQHISSSSSADPLPPNQGIHSTTVNPHSTGIALGAWMPDLANAQMAVDSDAIAMWSSAPNGFDLEEWGTYLKSVSEMTHGQQQEVSSGSYGL